MFIQSLVATNSATLGFISMKWSYEIARVAKSPKRNPNLGLQQIWQPKKDWLMAKRLKMLIINSVSAAELPQLLCCSGVPCSQPPSTNPLTGRAETTCPLWDAHGVLQGLWSFCLSISCPHLGFQREQRKVSMLPAEGKGTRYDKKV